MTPPTLLPHAVVSLGVGRIDGKMGTSTLLHRVVFEVCGRLIMTLLTEA